MAEPVKAGQDRNGKIGRRGAGKIHHRFPVRTLNEVRIHHFELPRWFDQEFKVVRRDHHDIADRFEPGVIPDGSNIAGRVREGSLAGRIDQRALVGTLEILRNALRQLLKQDDLAMSRL